MYTGSDHTVHREPFKQKIVGGIMKEYTVKELGARLHCAIDWPRKVVGVQFLFTEKEFTNADAVELKKPINYCRMVKSATLGHSIKADIKAQGCIAASRALGFEIPDENHRSGNRGLNIQLYHDLGTAKYTRDRQTLCDHTVVGVMIKPLLQYEVQDGLPHVVLAIVNPYYAMRLIQGYTYYYGIQTNFKMSGLQAICSESTAYTYMSNDINLSTLCGGTRMYCKWSDNELAVAIPYTKFPLTVEGTLRTMDLQDNNEKKNRIRKKLAENNMEDEFTMHDDFSYCDLALASDKENKENRS